MLTFIFKSTIISLRVKKLILKLIKNLKRQNMINSKEQIQILIKRIKVIGVLKEIEFKDSDFKVYETMSDEEAHHRLTLIKEQLVKL